MRLKSFFIIALVAAMVSCGNNGKNSGDMAGFPATGGQGIDSLSDFSGVYKGTMPAADCPGIEVRITLNGDNTFESCNRYIEREEFFDEGTYSVDGNILTAVMDNGIDTVYYKIEDNSIVMLDRQKQEIDSPFAHMYRLHKMDYGESLRWGNYLFDVDIYGDTLTVTPHGLTVDNSAQEHDITGYGFAGAETGDLNNDGFPEIFVYLTSDGSGSYGHLVGYSVNDGKSMSLVSLPDVASDSKINKGYMGHDEMAIVESDFNVRFPVYNDGDSNAEPTGGMRQVKYKLVDGESCRTLQVESVTEY